MWRQIKFAIQLIEEAYEQHPVLVLVVLCGTIFLASVAGYVLLGPEFFQ